MESGKERPREKVKDPMTQAEDPILKSPRQKGAGRGHDFLRCKRKAGSLGCEWEGSPRFVVLCGKDLLLQCSDVHLFVSSSVKSNFLNLVVCAEKIPYDTVACLFPCTFAGILTRASLPHEQKEYHLIPSSGLIFFLQACPSVKCFKVG